MCSIRKIIITQYDAIVMIHNSTITLNKQRDNKRQTSRELRMLLFCRMSFYGELVNSVTLFRWGEFDRNELFPCVLELLSEIDNLSWNYHFSIKNQWKTQIKKFISFEITVNTLRDITICDEISSFCHFYQSETLNAPISKNSNKFQWVKRLYVCLASWMLLSTNKCHNNLRLPRVFSTIQPPVLIYTRPIVSIFWVSSTKKTTKTSLFYINHVRFSVKQHINNDKYIFGFVCKKAASQTI